jgi:type 1 fimbria pilin
MAYIGSNSNTVEAYTAGLPPIVSLSAVSAVGVGAVLDGLAVRQNAVLSVTTSAGVSAGAVQLEGSLDGVHFFNLGSAVSTTAASTTTAVTVTSAFARYVRAAVTTTVTGGTVSASVGLNG